MNYKPGNHRLKTIHTTRNGNLLARDPRCIIGILRLIIKPKMLQELPKIMA